MMEGRRREEKKEKKEKKKTKENNNNWAGNLIARRCPICDMKEEVVFDIDGHLTHFTGRHKRRQLTCENQVKTSGSDFDSPSAGSIADDSLRMMDQHRRRRVCYFVTADADDVRAAEQLLSPHFRTN